MQNQADTPTLTPEDEARINANLAHLRTQMNQFVAPDAIEAKLANAFRRQQRRSGWVPRMGEWFAPGAAIAASLSFAVWMVLGTAPVGTVASNAPPIASQDNGSPFIALQSLEQIALEPNPRVIETQVPKMMLASLGVPIAPDVAGDTLKAEMLVSAAGQPLALRLSY